MDLAIALITLSGGVLSSLGALMALTKMREEQLQNQLEQQRDARPSIAGRFMGWSLAALLTVVSWPRIRWLVRGSIRVMFFFLGGATVLFIWGGYLMAGTLAAGRPDIKIISPSEDAVVQREISVEIEARPARDTEFVCVFIRPLPGNPNQDYWPQEFPQPVGGDRWEASPVYVGVPDDRPGTPFNVCAVLRPSCPSVGEPTHVLPAGPSDCVLVTRQ